MIRTDSLSTTTVGRHIVLLAAASLALAGCAATEVTPAPSLVEVQEDVGFTITEQARIGGDLRADYEVAVNYLAQGRHDEGIAALQEIVAVAPELSAPSIDLGIAYHRVGDLEAAEKHLLLALETNPDHPITHNELGIVYRKAGRFAEARESYEAALTIYPGFHYARRNLAILCDLYLADLRCALENYEAYMATVPGDDEAAMWIADIRSRIGR